jgi:hypothetical protein
VAAGGIVWYCDVEIGFTAGTLVEVFGNVHAGATKQPGAAPTKCVPARRLSRAGGLATDDKERQCK